MEMINVGLMQKELLEMFTEIFTNFEGLVGGFLEFLPRFKIPFLGESWSCKIVSKIYEKSAKD